MSELSSTLKDNLIKIDGGYYISDESVACIIFAMDELEDCIERLVKQIDKLHELLD